MAADEPLDLSLEAEGAGPIHETVVVEPGDAVHNALTSVVSRVVAALTIPLASAFAAALLWLQNVAGIDLQVDPAVAASFVGSIILGAALLGLKWLEGRAKWEIAQAANLHEIGIEAARK